LRVQNEFERFDLTGAYAAATVLAVMAIGVLLAMTLLERRRKST
jgi:sulfate/thiosulfate transport system permease protein